MRKVIFKVVMFLVLVGSLFTGKILQAVPPPQGISSTAQSKTEVTETRLEELEQKIEVLEKETNEKKSSWIERIIAAGFLLLVGIVLFILLKIGLKKFEEMISEKEAIRESEQTLRIKTMVRLFHWLGSLAIICAILYMVLENFGVNVAPLLAGAGIVGLALGFGGQYLIRDLINGIFILLESQYCVNDVVKIGEYMGVVENVNLRVTTLRDAEGRVIIIPNGDVKIVVNLTKDYARAVLNIGVAYKENVDHVMNVIKAVGLEIRKDAYFGKLVLEDLEMLGVDDFAESQVTIKFRIKTLPSKQFEVARELRRRIKNRFDELGIEIPFPHRTIYWGAGKENAWFQDSLASKGGREKTEI